MRSLCYHPRRRPENPANPRASRGHHRSRPDGSGPRARSDYKIAFPTGSTSRPNTVLKMIENIMYQAPSAQTIRS